jgi:hypothetical protein
VLATYRLEHTPEDRLARTLSAWSISSGLTFAVLSALGGLLAGVTSPRTAIAVAGLLILASPALLWAGGPRRPGPRGSIPRNIRATATSAVVPTVAPAASPVRRWSRSPLSAAETGRIAEKLST